MKGLTLAVCLFVLITAVLCSHGYNDHHDARHHFGRHGHHDIHHGHHAASHGHHVVHHGYKYQQYCPLKTYSQTVTKKFLYDKHWEHCTGTAIRYRCDGYCKNYEYSYKSYGYGNGHSGFGNGRFGNRGHYSGHYGRQSCCRSASYGKKSQYIKFHCGHYGYKKEHWHTKEPTSCSCSYYC